MVTKFGEYMRILRIKRNEVMKDTANALDVTIPFLSAVENGKKKIPDEWLNKISKTYMLTDIDRKELSNAINSSATKMTLDLQNCNEEQKKLAFQFQRSFSDLDETTTKRIIDILNGKDV